MFSLSYLEQLTPGTCVNFTYQLQLDSCEMIKQLIKQTQWLISSWEH